MASYREISARLKDAGYCNERGEPFNPQSVGAMIEGLSGGRCDGRNAPLLPASDLEVKQPKNDPIFGVLGSPVMTLGV